MAPCFITEPPDGFPNNYFHQLNYNTGIRACVANGDDASGVFLFCSILQTDLATRGGKWSGRGEKSKVEREWGGWGEGKHPKEEKNKINRKTATSRRQTPSLWAKKVSQEEKKKRKKTGEGRTRRQEEEEEEVFGASKKTAR
jgi:hypothetical protein